MPCIYVVSNSVVQHSQVAKESAYNVGDLGLIPGLGRSTPVFWPGEFHGLYSPRVCKESDMTE